jgi:hypothetical protein
MISVEREEVQVVTKKMIVKTVTIALAYDDAEALWRDLKSLDYNEPPFRKSTTL